MSSGRSRFADVLQRNTSRLLAFAAFGFIGYTAALIVGNKIIFPVEKKKPDPSNLQAAPGVELKKEIESLEIPEPVQKNKK